MRRLLLVSLVLVPIACETVGATKDDAKGAVADLDPTSCLCDSPGATRCAGSVIEVCDQGRWAEQSRCAAPKTCFAAQCFEPTTECPSSVRYDGYVELAERLPPVQLGECVSGGEIGREATLLEQTPDRQQRAIVLAYPSGCPEPALDFDLAFGFDVDGVVISQAPALSLTIPAKEQGAFFRQTTRLRRVGLLMAGAKVAGTVLISDHQFSYDATTAATCPPSSNLPAALSMQSSCAWHEYLCAPCGP